MEKLTRKVFISNNNDFEFAKHVLKHDNRSNKINYEIKQNRTINTTERIEELIRECLGPQAAVRSETLR